MPECCLCVTVKSVSFALFSAGSQWTAGLEEPQHRQSSSPSLSSHSWNPLLLNNELNLSLASRGGLRTTLSLAEGFVAHVHVHTHTDVHTPARSYCHSLLPQVAVWKLLHWLAAEQKKTEGSAESGDIEGLWWRRKIGRRYEGGRGVCVCVSWRSTIAVSERFDPPYLWGFASSVATEEREDGSEKEVQQLCVAEDIRGEMKETATGYRANEWPRFLSLIEI